MGAQVSAVRDFLDDYHGWATADAALQEHEAMEAELTRLREENAELRAMLAGDREWSEYIIARNALKGSMVDELIAERRDEARRENEAN